jgi:uncharacterized membrane protein
MIRSTPRPISDRERQWLDRELSHWREAGILQHGQTEQILACYESDAERGQRKHSVARFALQGIAAFLIGLAALLVIGYNWNSLHWGVKLCLVFGSVAGTHALGFYLLQFARTKRLAEVVFFLGCLFYGAGIWLVAQVFHLNSHYPDGIWWWAIGVLPFALCLDTLLLHLLFAGLLALWAGVEVIGFPFLSPRWLWHWWPNSAFSLPLLAVPGLLWAYRKGSVAAVILYVPVLAWWVVLQAIAWHLEWQSLYLIGAIGAIFVIVAENHRHGSALAVPYRIYGTLMVAAALLPPSFVGFHQEIARWSSYRRGLGLELFVNLILFLVVGASLAAFSYLLRPLGDASGKNPFARLYEVLRRQWFPFGLVLVMAALSVLTAIAPGASLLATILANVAMIAFAIWLMRVGLREERGPLFAAGVIYFLIWSVCRYIDLFGDAGGMLGAALMFFLCGAALFGLAMFWGKRKERRHAG